MFTFVEWMLLGLVLFISFDMIYRLIIRIRAKEVTVPVEYVDKVIAIQNSIKENRSEDVSFEAVVLGCIDAAYDAYCEASNFQKEEM